MRMRTSVPLARTRGDAIRDAIHPQRRLRTQSSVTHTFTSLHNVYDVD